MEINDPKNQQQFPFFKTRLSIISFIQRAIGAQFWVVFLTMYFLFVHGHSPGCDTLCCPLGDVTNDQGSNTLIGGGGTPIMVSEDKNRSQMMIFCLGVFLCWIVWTRFSVDPVEEETMKEYRRAVAKEKSKHGGG